MQPKSKDSFLRNNCRIKKRVDKACSCDYIPPVLLYMCLEKPGNLPGFFIPIDVKGDDDNEVHDCEKWYRVSVYGRQGVFLQWWKLS